MTEDLENEIEGYGLFDERNPRSLINIVPGELANAMRAVPKELLLMDEKELRRKTKPPETINYLRLNFWLEYNRAQDKRLKMVIANIIRGACHREYFYESVLKRPERLAWILTPPADYAVVQADLFEQALEKLRLCLHIKPYNFKVTEKIGKDGEKVVVRTRTPNVGAIREIREITRMLSDRIQGAVVQRLAIKQHNLNEERQLPPGPATYDVDALEKLEGTISRIQGTLQALEAAPVVEEVVKRVDSRESEVYEGELDEGT